MASTELATGYISLAISTKGLGRQVAREFTGVERQADSSGKSAGSRFGKGFSTAVKAGALGAAVVGAVAAKTFASSVKLASDFDSSMRLVGVTTGETGKQMDSLRQLAVKMGSETSFSAQGASDAMLALAKGGMTAADIKAGALQSTLTLATAGSLDLGDAADYMVQGLNAFGLGADQAGVVAAALAGGANASTASVESMGEALSQVAASAALSGLSIQDTTAALAAFDNAGVKGSDAGTSLKTLLQNLIPTTESAATAMSDLGLITEDGSNKFFDAQGNIKSIAEVSGLLQNALKDQTKEQKLATLTTLFGSDASRAAAILAKEGATGLEKYTKATNDKNAAEALAANATKGFAGAMENFKGAIETAQIQFGTKFLPILTTGLKFLSGTVLPAISSVASTVEAKLGPAFAVASRAVSGFAGGLKTASPTVEAIKDFIAGLLPTLRNLGSQILGVVVPAFKSIGNLISTQLLPAFRAMLPVLLPVAKFMVKLFGGIIVEVIKGAVQVIKGIINVITGVFKLVVALVNGDWKAAWGAVKQIVMGAINAVIGALRVWMNLGILGLFKRGALTLLKSWTGLWTGIRNLATKALAGIRSLIGSGLSAVGRLFVSGAKAYVGFWRGLFNTLRSLTVAGFKAVRSFIGSGLTGIRNLIVGAAKAYVTFWRNLFTTLKTLTSSGLTAVRGFFRNILNWVGSTFKAGWAKLKGIITSPISSARSAISTILGAGKGGLQAVFSNAVKAVGKIWDGVKALAKSPVKFIVDTVINKGLLGAFRTISKAVGYAAGEKLSVSLPEGFAKGGYTGPGPKMKPAGIVHADEHVWTKAEMSRFPGGHKAMERLRKQVAHGRLDGLPGFFLGGRVPTPGPQNRHGSGYPWARWAGDIPAGMGTPVRAWKGGVIAAVRHLTTSYGKHVRINHKGEESLYAHLSKIAVNAGQRVAAGQTIGAVGNTGNSRGPHLHFEVKGGTGAIGRGEGDTAAPSFFDVVGKLKDKFTGPLGRLKELGSSPFAQMVSRIPHMVKDALLSKGKDLAGSAIDTVVGNVGKAFGLGRQAARVAGLKLGASSVGTYPGHQPSMNKAWDFMATGSTGQRIADHLSKHRKKYGISYLIWNRMMMRDYAKGGIPAGSWAPYFDGGSSNPNRAHTNHVHASFYDRGGYMQPGATVTMNATRKPEPVLTSKQWATMSTLAERGMAATTGGAKVENHYHGPFGPTAEQIAQASVNRWENAINLAGLAYT